MGADIYRIKYNRIPEVGGNAAAEFLEENLCKNDQGIFYVATETLCAVEVAGLDADAKKIFVALCKAVKKYGAFDVMVC